jgi:uncharacterized protein YciI
MFWLLLYDLVDDYLERRAPLRQAHLALAQDALARGGLVLAGALADPADRAVLVFRADEPSVIEDFVGHDPYVQHGLVTNWTIRKWNVVIGADADLP